jgi:hypothetical protein
VHVVQSSARDGALVRGYADGVEHPMAFGFAAGLTDSESFTTPFRDRGLPAIELEDDSKDVAKHTARDTVSRVEPAYVQQLGDQALGLARAYGDMDLAGASAPDRVFHSVPLVGVIHYPAAWSAPLAVLALAGLAAVVARAVRRGRVRGRRVIGGAALAVALLAGTSLLAALAAALYGSLEPNPNPDIDAYVLGSSGPFAIAAGILIAIAFALGYRALGRRVGQAELALGFLAVWLAFALLFSAAVPAAAYLFEWPLLVACGAWLVVLRTRSFGLLILLPAVVAVLLAAPMLLIGFFADGVASLPVQALVAGLIAGLIAPAVAPPAPTAAAT